MHAPFNEGVPRLMNAEGFVVATSAHAARQFALFDETGQWFLRVRRPVHRPANARRHGVLPRALLESVPSGAMQRWSHPSAIGTAVSVGDALLQFDCWRSATRGFGFPHRHPPGRKRRAPSALSGMRDAAAP